MMGDVDVYQTIMEPIIPYRNIILSIIKNRKKEKTHLRTIHSGAKRQYSKPELSQIDPRWKIHLLNELRQMQKEGIIKAFGTGSLVFKLINPIDYDSSNLQSSHLDMASPTQSSSLPPSFPLTSPFAFPSSTGDQFFQSVSSALLSSGRIKENQEKKLKRKWKRKENSTLNKRQKGENQETLEKSNQKRKKSLPPLHSPSHPSSPSPSPSLSHNIHSGTKSFHSQRKSDRKRQSKSNLISLPSPPPTSSKQRSSSSSQSFISPSSPSSNSQLSSSISPSLTKWEHGKYLRILENLISRAELAHENLKMENDRKTSIYNQFINALLDQSSTFPNNHSNPNSMIEQSEKEISNTIKINKNSNDPIEKTDFDWIKIMKFIRNQFTDNVQYIKDEDLKRFYELLQSHLEEFDGIEQTIQELILDIFISLGSQIQYLRDKLNSNSCSNSNSSIPSLNPRNSIVNLEESVESLKESEEALKGEQKSILDLIENVKLINDKLFDECNYFQENILLSNQVSQWKKLCRMQNDQISILQDNLSQQTKEYNFIHERVSKELEMKESTIKTLFTENKQLKDQVRKLGFKNSNLKHLFMKQIDLVDWMIKNNKQIMDKNSIVKDRTDSFEIKVDQLSLVIKSAISVLSSGLLLNPSIILEIKESLYCILQRMGNLKMGL